MSNSRTIKRCVGPIIYNQEGKIFLMKSHKWRLNEKDEFGNVWIVPGGEIEKNENGVEIETPEEALEREIDEELGIKIERIEYVGSSYKSGEKNFKKPNIDFEFIDFIARTRQSEISPNSEITEYGWFTIEEAERLPLLDTTAAFIQKCKKLLEERVAEFRIELGLNKK
jgi:8-oxo-dGTP pyrophosphatase MutT (NUDIX family)